MDVLLQERQRSRGKRRVLFQVGEAKCGKFGGIVVLTVCVMLDVALLTISTNVAGCYGSVRGTGSSSCRGVVVAVKVDSSVGGDDGGGVGLLSPRSSSSGAVRALGGLCAFGCGACPCGG